MLLASIIGVSLKSYILNLSISFSKAILFDNPVSYCRANHDLYVNYNATFPLCRLGKESIDFWEEIEERNLDVLEMKMRLAKLRVSKEACQQHLRCVYC